MAKQTTTTTTAITTAVEVREAAKASADLQTQVSNAETRGQALINPILEHVRTVMVTDAETYLTADGWLVKIRSARAQIAAQVDPIIAPIRKGLDALYALRRRLDGPLEEAEAGLKRKMATWQSDERRREEEENRKRREEARRLELEAEAARARAEQAAQVGTAQQQRKAEAQASVFEQRAEEARVTPAAVSVARTLRASGSVTREEVRWRVTDLDALVAAVVSGAVPSTVLKVDEQVMDQYWSADRAMVQSWAGVESYVATTIAGRGGRSK